MEKRGQVGFDVAKSVILALFVLGLLAFAILIALSQLGDTSVAKTSKSNTVLNEAGAYFNQSGYTVTTSTDPDFAGLTVTSAVNTTSGLAIASGNWTVTGSLIQNASAVIWDAVTLNYTYTSNVFTGIEGNISSGTVSFFSNATAWFGLLAVVVIILIVSIVLIAVRRFGGSQGGGL